jgi:hypothetical protein
MIRFRVANPHEWPSRLSLAAVEKRRPDAKDRVPITDDPAFRQVYRAAQVDRVAGTRNRHVAQDVL